ncbi:MAG TPA: Ig-like domain-containing protein [Longimicrobiaceae bacterium]
MKLSRTLLAVGLLAAAACSDIPTSGVRSTGGPSRNGSAVNRVAVSSATIGQGGYAVLSATAYDANNNPISAGSTTWSSATPSVASVNSAGVVTGNSQGTATVYATIGGVVGSGTVTVSGVTTFQNQTVQCYYLQNDVVWVDEAVWERQVTTYSNAPTVTGTPYLTTYHTYDVGPYMGGDLPCGSYDENNWS